MFFSAKSVLINYAMKMWTSVIIGLCC